MSDNGNTITITIKAKIACLDLSLAEKVALAAIEERPAMRNTKLAKILCQSRSGTKMLISRLRDAGLLSITGNGPSRRISILLPAPPAGSADETGHKMVGQCVGATSQKVADLPEAKTTGHLVTRLLQFLLELEIEFWSARVEELWKTGKKQEAEAAALELAKSARLNPAIDLPMFAALKAACAHVVRKAEGR